MGLNVHRPTVGLGIAAFVMVALAGCGGSSSPSSAEAALASQNLTGCVEQKHADLELFVTRGWECDDGQSFLWFANGDAEKNWKKTAAQFGWDGKSGDGWVIEED